MCSTEQASLACLRVGSPHLLGDHLLLQRRRGRRGQVHLAAEPSVRALSLFLHHRRRQRRRGGSLPRESGALAQRAAADDLFVLCLVLKLLVHTEALHLLQQLRAHGVQRAHGCLQRGALAPLARQVGHLPAQPLVQFCVSVFQLRHGGMSIFQAPAGVLQLCLQPGVLATAACQILGQLLGALFHRSQIVLCDKRPPAHPVHLRRLLHQILLQHSAACLRRLCAAALRCDLCIDDLQMVVQSVHLVPHVGGCTL
mmetsp:Transcript_21137/g.53242  ORF Transcript_21137/g.53242 Transcript_21137/m.53242 type:complete len:255 (+) Transcript_21137:2707-3471(+)